MRYIFAILLLTSCYKPISVLKKSSGERVELSYENVVDASEIVFHSRDLSSHRSFVFIDLKDKHSIESEASYGFSFKISGEIDDSARIIIAKFDQVSHKTGKKAPAVLSFYLQKGKIYGEVRYSKKTKGDKNMTKIVFIKIPFKKETWYAIDFSTKWSLKGGELEGTLNDKKIKYKGPIGIKSLKSGKMKIGIMQKHGRIDDYKVVFKGLRY